FSPDGGRALIGGQDNVARLWDVKQARELGSFRHDDFVVAVAFHPTNGQALTGSYDGTSRLWQTGEGRQQEITRFNRAARPKPRKDESVTAVAFSRDGRTALTGGSKGTAWVWDRPFVIWGGEQGWLWAPAPPLATLPHDATVLAAAVSPDG